MLNFDFNIPCQTSPRWCYQGSPGGLIWTSWLRKYYHMKFYWKFGWLLYKYLTFQPLDKRKKKEENAV